MLLQEPKSASFTLSVCGQGEGRKEEVRGEKGGVKGGRRGRKGGGEQEEEEREEKWREKVTQMTATCTNVAIHLHCDQDVLWLHISVEDPISTTYPTQRKWSNLWPSSTCLCMW